MPEARKILESLFPGKSGSGSVPAVDVLSHLIENQKLSIDDVKAAHQSCRTSKDSQRDKSAIKEKEGHGNKLADSSTNDNVVMRTRHVALHIFYCGEKYSGLAENVGQKEDNSIERFLFAALEKTHLIQPGVCGKSSREMACYSRCGRTDKGVSAAGQVVGLWLKSAFTSEASWDEEGVEKLETKDLPKDSLQKLQVYCPPRKKSKKNKSNSNLGQSTTNSPKRTFRTMTELPYDKILNSVLPPEIRVMGWTPVTDEFSARFSATTRTYRYFFTDTSMNLDKMRVALKLLEGEHDFRNFCKMDVEHVYNFVRKIHYARVHVECVTNTTIEESEGKIDSDRGSRVCYFEIHGQAFLWHQIRCIVSILFLVGRELEEPSIVTELLDIEKYPGKPSYDLADERPLVLHHCGFPALQLGYSVANLWNLNCSLHKQYEDLMLEAFRLRNGIRRLHEDAEVRVEDVRQFCHTKLIERKKKASRYGRQSSITDPDLALSVAIDSVDSISWSKAVEWMRTNFNMHPDPFGVKDVTHIPISRRSMGTSFDEKVASLQQNSKRRAKYEENMSKKRSKEDDQAFYDHMTKQGS